MNALRDWWNQNTPRDQMAMFVLGLALTIYVLYAIVKATHGSYTAQLQQNERANASLSEVRELSSELLARNAGAGGEVQGSVTEQVNNSLREFNLNLSSMQPQSDGAVRLRMEHVRYSDVIAWLHEMEVTQGVKIKDSTITTGSEKGVVNITVTLQK